jgi:RNA polymerase sigma factor (sigma-70 family)
LTRALRTVTLKAVLQDRFRVTHSLLERIAAGDAAAVTECMNVYGNLVWALARRMSASAPDAEDAVQEIFLEIWKSAARYDASVASEAVFITTISRRRLIDRLRARKRRPVTEEFDEELIGPRDESDHGAIAVEASIASRALEQLGESQREILLLGIVDGLTHSEIATATGKPLGTVKTQMRRGLMKIRELLGTDTPAEED